MSASPTNRPDIRPARSAYGPVLAAVALAAVARWALGPVAGDYVPFATFFVAIVFGAWRGGLYPALVATALGFVLTVALFPSSQFAGTGLSRRRVVGWLLYFAVCGAIAIFGEAMWRARRRLQGGEQAAREQARLLQTTFASIGDAVVTADAAGVVTYLNPVAEQLTGCRLADARGRPLSTVFEIVNEHTRARIENPVDKVLALGQVVGLANHTVLIAKDGVERPIDDSAAPIRDDDGRIIGAVLVFRDVTDRRRAEEQLRRQGEMFRAISDNTTDLVYVKDRAHRLLFANTATLRALGLPDSAGLSDVQDALAHYPSESETVRTSDERIMAAGVGEEGDTEFSGVHGLRAYLTSKTPMRDAGGRVVGLVAITRDITDRHRTEQRLQESEARFRLLADALPQIVYVTEPDGRVTFVNQQWREYTGQADAQQADLTPLVHPDDLPALTAAWQRSAESGTPLSAEFRLRRALDGAYRWFLTRSVPVVDEARRVVRWHGTSTDIHEHKLAEERTRAGEARQMFLVQLSDELRRVGDPTEVQAVASRLLGLALGAHRVSYFEVVGERYRVVRDYVNGVKSLVGDHPAEAFGAALRQGFERGEVASVADVEADPGLSAEQRAAFHAIDIRAHAGVPLVKDGAFVAGLAVHDTRPRTWTPDEIALIQDTAERTWAAVERARVEAALVASEARFRALFDTMDEGFCVVEVIFDDAGRAVDYHVLEMNPACARHDGLQDALKRPTQEFAPGLEEFWLETYGRVASTGESTRFVRQAQSLEARWFDVYAFRLGGDGSRKVATLFTDVTARTMADQAAALRSEQVRRLAAVLPRISATTDIRSIMGVVSAEARALIDTHQATATVVNGDDWPHAVIVTSLSDKYAAWRDFERQPTGQGIYSLVCRHNRPMRLTQSELEAHPAFHGFGEHRGEHPPLNGWLAVPLVGRDGRNMGVLQLSDKVEGMFTIDDEAVLTQVAQMASVAIDNARLVDDLQLADRRKDEFLSVLAHELRNPLAPIRSGLHLMKILPDDAASVARAREVMDRQVTHMVRIIDDLMDVTRISRGKLLVRKTPIALADVLSIAVETSRPLVEQAAQTLTVEVPEIPLVVDADETRLAQVFANLLNNAAKYTPPGGRVGLYVRREGPEAVVTVADNGVGIPSAMLGQVFDMFTQVDRSLEKSQGGLGIGLNIARRLVEKHGGRISAESDGEGRGSRFVVHLPLVDPPSAAALPPQREPVSAGAQRRVLVVDDNIDTASSLRLLFEAMGHETRTAHDGRDAVAAAEQFRPDLILMDIGLPIMSGYDACRQIRKQPWAGDVLMVACTGWGQEEDRQRSTQAGFDLHLVKPPSPAALESLAATLRSRP